MLRVVCFFCVCAVLALGFTPAPRFGRAVAVSRTHLNENFRPNEINIVSDPLIFSEKQLREYTATYSVDERINVVQWFLGLFKKKDDGEEAGAASGVTGKLKSTVSVAVLEEKTAAFVQGKSDAKAYYNVLTAAFGANLPSVLPQILSNLPTKKANELKKIAK